MSYILTKLNDAVERQRYTALYIPQLCPGVGAVVSIPTALYSGTCAIAKMAQAFFESIKDGKPFFRPGKGMDNVKFAMEDAKDLGFIFLNNVANTFTLGFLNCFIVGWTLNNIFINKKDLYE